ncbi:unnamed protein product [Dracunculus medinensis]|uniref:CUB domain-containing protein n=1 Tax=Dracunculus medinensis TaxID=318479 RepID=A0A0N4UR17_DRAME|nr:unnamed protein product [Dracunculus medinensis]
MVSEFLAAMVSPHTETINSYPQQIRSTYRCGGHINNATGVIKYPDWMWFYYGRNKSCEWVISVDDNNNKFIEMNFTRFNLSSESSSETGSLSCLSADSKLTLRDGASSNSPLIGIYCGQDGSNKAVPTSPIHFSSGNAYILFQSSNDILINSGFTIQWSMVEKMCGGRLYGNEGSISLYEYEPNIKCQWHVNADPQMHIEITVDPIQLGSGVNRNCSLNSLEIFDGLQIDQDIRIMHLCSSETYPILARTTLPNFSVYFTSAFHTSFDDHNQLDKDCGGMISTDANGIFSGIIQSPNYGFNYFPSLDCLWLLDASFSHNFKDGGDASKPILGKYCNDRRPAAAIVSTGPKMVIQFHSDDSVSGKACEKHFTSRNGTIQSPNYPSGTSIPLKCTYVIIAERTKAIRVKFNYIGLNFTIRSCFYEIGNQDKSQDYVEFVGGHDSHSHVNKRYRCQRYPFVAPEGEIVTSAYRPLRIIYSSSSIENKGILFYYEQMDVGCGGVFEGESGKITSPNFPDNYLSHMYYFHKLYTCCYGTGEGDAALSGNTTDLVHGLNNRLRTMPRFPQYIEYMMKLTVTEVSFQLKRILLNFDVFELEVVPNREDCAYDGIEIYDSYKNDHEFGHFYGRFCGALQPPSVLSNGNQLTLVFKSDRSVSGQGFSANWKAVNIKNECDRSYTAVSGKIQIKVDKEHKSTDCNYHIALPTMKRILLKIENFSLPCEEGTLMIRNGVNEQSPAFSGLFRDSEICDEHPVEELRSQGNRLFLRLKTLNTNNYYFNIIYEQVDSNCGGLLNGISGALSAPQYPLKDSRTLNCDWHIAVAYGNRIVFTITSIDDLNSADHDGFCSSFAPNYIDIADGPIAKSLILRRYCKKEVSPPSVNSETNEMTIRYRQHGGSHFGSLFGFIAHYKTVCYNIHLSGYHGMIQSPGYLQRVYENRFCKWTIHATQGNRIRLTFHLFRISEKKSPFTPLCLSNYLELEMNSVENVTAVIDGKPISNTTERKFCDEIGVPLTVLSKNNLLQITFASNNPENHFWLSWSIVVVKWNATLAGCGGILLSETDIEIRIADLIATSTAYECIWTITSPLEKSVQFTIDEFAIFNGSADCPSDHDEQFNGIAFYSGLSNKSGIAQQIICTSVSSTMSYMSNSNELFVKLLVQQYLIKHDSNNRFFRAKVRFITRKAGEECGSMINVQIGQTLTIHSPNYPNPYSKSIACIWHINTAITHILQFNLTHYTTLGHHPRKLQQYTWRPKNSAYNYQNNITCQNPVTFIEGSISFYDGNSTTSELLERLCHTITEPQIITTTSNQAIVLFQGAPYERAYLSGDDETVHVIGFMLSISLRCGGSLIASTRMKTFQLHTFADDDECKIAIRADGK